MPHAPCPICQRAAWLVATTGDSIKVDCVACGKFTITGSADACLMEGWDQFAVERADRMRKRVGT